MREQGLALSPVAERFRKGLGAKDDDFWFSTSPLIIFARRTILGFHLLVPYCHHLLYPTSQISSIKLFLQYILTQRGKGIAGGWEAGSRKPERETIL